MFTLSRCARPLVLLAVVFLLAACGGGGGGSSDQTSTFTVSATSGAGGNISPTSQVVDHGGTATFVVTPEAGYSIAAVNGCGGILDGNTYTTGSITETCAVNASFSLLLPAPQNLQATAGGGAVLLQWADIQGVDAYTLYHATEGGIQPDNFGIWMSQHDGVMIENVTSPQTVEGLNNGTEYFFVVTGSVGGQESGPSNEVRATPQESPVVTGRLNDTGITFSGGATGNAGFCDPAHPAGQDCHHGRDAQAVAGTLTKVGGGNAGFDFTKIANNGSVLPASAPLGSGPNDWACTRDNVTGLIWEVKVNNSAHLRHQGHTYTWYDPNSPDGNEGVKNGGFCVGSDCDTTGFMLAVNSEGLCGASDWRIPALEELHGLVNYGRFSPAIDAGYFPNTPSRSYWSASPHAGTLNNAWGVNFNDGYLAITGRMSTVSVRLARGAW